MAERTQLRERYELREVIGRGGMGVVYRAWDQLMNREVALKTLLEVDNPASLSLFFKEWGLLAAMVHPNIISIYDIGEFEQEGVKYPFFVMPLLVGSSLDKLIREGSPRFDVARILDIVAQASRGLQAAHDMGLVHRDVKPSNIFVLDDLSVKIIDFGIARMASAGSNTRLKGTLSYLPPEQLQLKPPTPLGDQYSLAVVAYQALTRTLPFRGATDQELTHAILHHSPPPVSEVNGVVSYLVSQTVHKGMARSPWHRFPNIREFGETLLKALRNESISYFDVAQIKPRLDKALENFERGEHEFAADILAELEGEGHLDQQIVLLRRQVEQAIRQKRIRVLLENARRFQEAEEYTVALRKVQEALDLAPQDPDSLALKSAIEKERREKKIVEWNQIARQHLANESFQQAREALSNILRAKPHDAEALQLMAEVTRGEQELERRRDRKSQLYSEAMESWERGEVTSALSKLELLAGLERERPDTDSGLSATFQSFYNKVRSEHDLLKNQYSEARQLLAEDDFPGASRMCQQVLAKYPNHAMFQALDYDIRERQSQKRSSYIAEMDQRLEREPDLDRRVSLLEEALRQYPGEAHFEQALRLVREKRDLVNSIVMKARYFEEKRQFGEALDQWNILRSIYPEYPGLRFELERLTERRDQHNVDSAKAQYIEQIERSLAGGDYQSAVRMVTSALAEFPDDLELSELARLARNSEERARQAGALVARAQVHLDSAQVDQGLALLREASLLDPLSSTVQAMLVNTLIGEARERVESDPATATAMVDEVLALEPNHPAATSLAVRLRHARMEEELSVCLAEARRLQADGDAAAALAILEPLLVKYPTESRLVQLKASLLRTRVEQARLETLQQTRTVQPLSKASPGAPVATPEAATPSTRSKAPLIAGIVVAACLVLGVFGFAATKVAALVLSRVSEKPAPAVAPAKAPEIAVAISVSPAQATITVDGRPCGQGGCDLRLTAGAHQVTATLAGYIEDSRQFDLTASGIPPVHLELAPATPQLSVSTNLPQVQVWRNQGAPVMITGAEQTFRDVEMGTHLIRIAGGASEAYLTATFAPAEVPQVKTPLLTRAFDLGVVASQGGKARIYSSQPAVTVSLDGGSSIEVPATGLDLQSLQPGRHEAVLQVPNRGTRTVVFDVSAAPSLVVVATADLAVAGLRILSNEDGATVLLNGAPLPQKIARGQLLIYLPPKPYSVRVEKSGFVTPAEQSLLLKRGQESVAQFHLVPAPRAASLNVRSSVPGADVLLDGRHLGATGNDGRFSTAVEVGRHRIEVSKTGHRTYTVDLDFQPGRTVEIAAVLATASGTLRVNVQPANVRAQLEIQREGEALRSGFHSNSQEVAEGNYTIFASAQGFRPASINALVRAGQASTVTVVMEPLATTAPAAKPGAASSNWVTEWERVPGWERAGSGLVRQGGDWIFYPSPMNVSLRFRGSVAKGTRLTWALVRDGLNRVEYRLDREGLERQETTDGKRGQRVRLRFAANVNDTFEITLRASGASLETVIQSGSGRTTDTYVAASRYAGSSFGLQIPRRDIVNVVDFALR